MWKLIFPHHASRLAAIRAGRTQDVAASRPAALTPAYLRWASTYRSECSRDLGLLGATLLAALAFHPALWLAALWQAGRVYSYWNWVTSLFVEGCVNPAVVISVNPVRLACYADLTLAGGTWPALKVLQLPDSQKAWSDASVGERASCVCFYRGDSQEAGMWADFHPIPDRVLTAASEELERLRAGLEQDPSEGDLWTKLELAQRIVGGEPGLGLYRLGWEPVSAEALHHGGGGVGVDLAARQAQLAGGQA